MDAGEEGIAGITVTLTYPDGTTEEFITEDDGKYLFDELLPGDYTVTFTDLPEGYTFSPPNEGDDDELDSDVDPTDGTIEVTLDPSEDDLTEDAGIVPPRGSIGNMVFVDENGDGIMDATEPGIAGIVVTLTYPDGTTATDTTDADGKYLFEELPAGDYTVTFELPTDYTFSPQDEGTDDELDSDPDPTDGSVDVTLGEGEDNPTIDAGVIPPTGGDGDGDGDGDGGS